MTVKNRIEPNKIEKLTLAIYIDENKIKFHINPLLLDQMRLHRPHIMQIQLQLIYFLLI